MRIDPKYFNTFLLIVAIIAAILIALFTYSNRTTERSDFRQRMFSQDSLQTMWFSKIREEDSLRVQDFEGQFVVLDFWSDWSDVSEKSHRQLARIQDQYPDKLQVIAASVNLLRPDVLSYIQEHQFPFQFVEGSSQFSDFNMPGLPAQMMFNRRGELKHVFLGYSDDAQYDSLKVLIENEL